MRVFRTYFKFFCIEIGTCHKESYGFAVFYALEGFKCHDYFLLSLFKEKRDEQTRFVAATAASASATGQPTPPQPKPELTKNEKTERNQSLC